MTRGSLAAYFLGLLLAGRIPQTAPNDVPEKLKAQEGEKLILAVHGTGSQIYVCQAGSEQKFLWVFKAPEAELHDAKGKVVGSHSAGPTWKYEDGSEVTAKMTAHQDSPDPDSIPWLLLTATGHAGTGILARVTSIQRLHTKGGQPPQTGCDESHRGTETKRAYSADYYFYTPAQ